MRKRLVTMLTAIILLFLLCACSAEIKDSRHVLSEEELQEKWGISRTAGTSKIIMDIDMMYVNDDAYAVLLAAQADTMGYIDLLGITSTTCNVFASASAYDTLYLLQEINRSDIPVYLGESMPRNGFVDIEKYIEECGLFDWYGCYASIDRYTEDVNKAYELGVCGAPGSIRDSAVRDESAVDFIIEQIHKYPGEVTLITLSSLTTISRAIEKDATIVDEAAGIIVMGGDFGARIDGGRDYEINLWFDPEASNMVLAAPWKERIMVSSDVALTCQRNKEVYEQLKAKNTGKTIRCMVDFLAPTYENGKEEKIPYCWDSIAIVYYLCPDIITNTETRAVCVDEREGLTYGLTRDWRPGTEPCGVNTYNVLFACSDKDFWDFVSDICSIDK